MNEIHKTGTTKSGDKIDLFIDNEEQRYAVAWYNLCGYCEVTLQFAFGDDAEAFFNAALLVTDIEED